MDVPPAGGRGDAPPILFRLAEKECAVHGGRKRRFWPLYTKADGRFLRQCRPDPEIFYRVRCTLYVSRYCSAASCGGAVFVGGEPKGPCVLAPRVPLRYALLRRLTGCPILPGYARNAREQKDSPFGFPPRRPPDSRDLRQKAVETQRGPPQPAGAESFRPAD